MRTADSRTYEQADGTFITEAFAGPVFYQPEGTMSWELIDARFAPSTELGVVAEVEHSAARIQLSAADAATGFLTLTGKGHDISFGLPSDIEPGQAGAEPEISADGLIADYADFLPGGIGLRVLAADDGFKSFLVLPSRPVSNAFSFAIDAPGLDLVAEENGSFTFRDDEGAILGRIPRPFLMDSSEVEGLGGGLYSEAVTMSVATHAQDGYILTLTVDPLYLDSAVYPVYLDPSTEDFPDTSGTTAADTFASERYPNSNFNTYARPDSPYYKEMWHGYEPGIGDYDEVFIRFNDIRSVTGTAKITEATLKFFPYWQYYHSGGRPSQVARVNETWDASTLDWNNRPDVDSPDLFEDDTTEDVWSDFDMKDQVQQIVNMTLANHGWKIYAADYGQGSWKRIVSRNNSTLKPKLTVTWSAFVPSQTFPNLNESSSRVLSWVHDSAAPSGSSWQVEFDDSSGFTTLLASSGTQTSADTFWTVPSGVTLNDGQTYHWRVRAKYGGNSSFSAWASTSFTYRSRLSLGLPAHNRFESFDLGSGDTLSVNAATRNVVLSHPIVSLPIRGGSLAFGLTYNSHSTTNVGMGMGWRLNAMRRLIELGNNNVLLSAGDGSQHLFTYNAPVGGILTYTRPATIYATLTKNTGTGEWTLTYRDQSKDVFADVGWVGRLISSADRHGNTVSYTYKTDSGDPDRLYRVTDPAGRYVEFTWDTTANPDRLTSMTDWAYIDANGIVQATQTGSRRQYRFFYDSGGSLIGWSDPLNTSGSCPTVASHLTCLSYSSGQLATITKRQTYAKLAGTTPETITTDSRDVTTQILYSGGAVSEVRDAEQYASSATGTTFTQIAADQLRVVRQGTPASTTTYGVVSTTDTLARIQSVWRKLGTSDIEQRTAWNSTYATEPASVTDNYGGLLSTPARTISYTYWSSTLGLLKQVEEPLAGSDKRTADYTYNANNDVTQVVVGMNGGSPSTTTRYCYTTSGCATSGSALTLNAVIENHKDGTKGGTFGNEEDVTTEYQYSNGQITRETRWNYDRDGNLLDSRVIAYEYDTSEYGNQIKTIANYSASHTYDSDPDPATGARTNLTTVFGFDTAGNQISVADPRRAIGSGLGADDYVSIFEYDALNQQTRFQVARDPLDTSAPKYSTTVYDEIGALRSSTDFGGLVSATEFDRAGRATRTFEDPADSAPAVVTSVTTFDSSGRVLSSKDRNQAAPGGSGLGSTQTDYDELGRVLQVTEAAGTGTAAATVSEYDALDRLTSVTVGGVQETTTTYDLGGRAIAIDDEFTCTTVTFDYRDLAQTEITGKAGGCTTGSEQRTIAHSYDDLGRRTQSEVTAGSDDGDLIFDVALDSAGRQLSSSVTIASVESQTDFAYNPLDQLIAEERSDDSTAKANYDAAGNPTDRCFWEAGITVGSCYQVGTDPWTSPPTQVTTSVYDARNSRIELREGSTGATTEYDPNHNYAVSAFYLPTDEDREYELQTAYGYDERHRLISVEHVQCDLVDPEDLGDHACSSSTSLGSDEYAYDENDNRTEVDEDNGATATDFFYCYDALNRLQYRNTGSSCSDTVNDEAYEYDDAGNRLGAPGQTFSYNGSGQLTGCTSDCDTVSHDSAGNIERLGSWNYQYDAQGRLVRACLATSCTGTGDEVRFEYDGVGHRTRIETWSGGVLESHTDFVYQGDSIVAESTDDVQTREYVVDDTGRILRFCDPDCGSPTATYLVTWNGHGDAMGVYLVGALNGALTLVNSYSYSTWGTPTTTVSFGFSDLDFRFLYLGASDAQWDAILKMYYMHARHYSPMTSRFHQPDPPRAESNVYVYARNNPVSWLDPYGTYANLFGAQPNDLEIAKCQRNPQSCNSWYRAAKEGYAIAVANYPRGLRGIYDNGRDGPRRDAIRHCSWMCLLTFYTNETDAFDWGMIHELGGGWRLSSIADVHNNRVGIRLGNQIRGDWLGTWDAYRIVRTETLCIRELAAGRLWMVVDGGTRIVRSSR